MPMVGNTYRRHYYVGNYFRVSSGNVDRVNEINVSALYSFGTVIADTTH